MTEFLGQNINNGLYIIYGLVAVVVILIIVIVVLDRKETKRRKLNEKLLSNTLNFKPITDETYIDKNVDELDVVELKKDEPKKESKIEKDYDEYEDFDEINEIEDIPTPVEPVQQQLDLSFEDEYKEEELDKTQAQIRVEEITKALEKAVIEERQAEEDRYQAFEEEQEKNAIISYQELKVSYDKLYEENEKVQYMDDDNIPINIDELYEYNRTKPENIEKQPEKVEIPVEEKVEVKVEEPKKVQMEDFNPNKQVFKRSPYISPVYGIQKPEDEKKEEEINNASNFLNEIKELRDNLE